MHNSRLDDLRDYPFQKLARLLETIDPPTGMTPIALSIGEPQHPPPALLADTLAAHTADWGRYPPTPGTPEFRETVASWLKNRYALPDGMITEKHVLPVSGTREALFNIALYAIPQVQSGERPVVLIPDPFYQIYAGAAAMAGAEPVFLPADADNGFLPNFGEVSESVLARTALCYLCSPSNPQGSVADLAYWQNVIGLARRHDFLLAADECYCELYDRIPPPGALEAAAALDGTASHVLAFHSLSKRSSVPGLRSGFVAGDPDVVAGYAKLRTYTGGASPLPILAAATALWADEAHVKANRALYRRKFDIAERILSGRLHFYRPPAGFYLWLDVGDGERCARELWHRAGVKVLPGAYLSRPREDGSSPGDRYIRIALVHDVETTEEALMRLAATL
ncbi:MAG: aspartate aminotransferase [Rhodospirillaceae bacterium]|nr:aspartate aminotransferase [Rhodospirillaceae bacterium]